MSNGTAEEDIRAIDERPAQGFLSFMLKMGTSPVHEEVKRVATLEAHYASRIKLIADSNQGWSRDQAREFPSGVSGSGLVFVEQPVAKDDYEGMALLAKTTSQQISADESLTGLAEAARLAELGAAGVFSIKSSKNGEQLRAQRIAAVAGAFGIRCYMNSMMELGVTQAASVQHAVTVRNLIDVGHAFMSTLRFAEDPTNFSSFVRNGVVYQPSATYLCVEIDEPQVRRMTVGSFHLEAPR